MSDFFVQPTYDGSGDTTKQEKIFTVSEINALVNQYLQQIQVTVQGEVSGFKTSQGKWIFFDLKDEKSVLPCFFILSRLQFPVEDGMEIKIKGRPGIYSQSGRYTFRVDSVEPVGEGALKRAFELTKAKLEKEGLFDPQYKKPLPRFPQTIGLITSTDAAAYTDVLKILKARWQGLDIIVYNTRVQGVDSIPEIVSGLEYFNQHQPVDVMILTRGGGSLEDLQSFNSEAVCRAVFASKIPVVCGIGHERDTCLAEMVADQRASTPTNAAQLCVPDKIEVAWQLQSFQNQLHRDIKNQTGLSLSRVGEQLGRLNYFISEKIKNFTATFHQLQMAGQIWQNKLQELETKVKNQLNILNILNPLNILARGYSVTYDAKGQLIKSISQLKDGQLLKTRLSDGEINSKVKKQLELI